MEIYVVQQGDNIELIANKYGISVERLISDNGLINPYSLVVGQTLVILYPKSTYIVKQGDTLTAIADNHGISIMQLIRNNPFIYDKEYIYPEETLVIDFNTIKDIQVNGYTNAFISQETLIRSLPYLTYVSIFNYQITAHDSTRIISFGDDSHIIKMAKQYSTIPLLMLSTLSPTGDVDVEFVYKFLLDISLQDYIINEMLQIIRSKEFMGVNLLISYISEYNQRLYLSLFEKMSELLRNAGYIFMITISPDYSDSENLDYHSISLFVDRIIFLQNIWIKRKQPPAPISDISLIRPFIENVISKVSPKYVSLGKPLIGYDWIVPFVPGSTASFMSLNSAVVLAYDQGALIHLDEESQTPYFDYIRSTEGFSEKHKVWFIDANSLKATDEVVIEFDLIGTGIWNISSHYQQLFSIISAFCNFIKLPIE
jgi:spore germination protein